jgi:hypothetical protein
VTKAKTPGPRSRAQNWGDRGKLPPATPQDAGNAAPARNLQTPEVEKQAQSDNLLLCDTATAQYITKHLTNGWHELSTNFIATDVTLID